jgi:hypothetical protein
LHALLTFLLHADWAHSVTFLSVHSDIVCKDSTLHPLLSGAVRHLRPMGSGSQIRALASAGGNGRESERACTSVPRSPALPPRSRSAWRRRRRRLQSTIAAPMRLSVSLPSPARRRSRSASADRRATPSVPAQALVVVNLPHAACQLPHLPHCCRRCLIYRPHAPPQLRTTRRRRLPIPSCRTSGAAIAARQCVLPSCLGACPAPVLMGCCAWRVCAARRSR